MNDFNQKVSNAKKLIILKLPFYSLYTHSIKVFEIENSDVPDVLTNMLNQTAYTNGKSIYFYKKFHESLTQAEFNFVFLHELLHIVNLHVSRAKLFGVNNHRKYNYAADYVINNIIVNHFENSMSKDLSKRNKFLSVPVDGEGKNIGLHDSKYSGYSTEEVYHMLDDNDCKGGITDLIDNGKLSKEDIEQLKSLAAKSKVFGLSKLSTSQEREFREILKPKVTWKKILKSQLSFDIENYSMTRRDRRFIQSDFFLPGIDDSDAVKVAIVVDTSGSINAETCTKFVTEVYSLLQIYKNKEVHIYSCDDMIRSYSVLRNISDLEKFEIKGNGGTSFIEPFEDIKKRRIKIDSLVYFTDGYGVFPDLSLKMNTIWMLTTPIDIINVPFGKKIFYDLNNE